MSSMEFHELNSDLSTKLFIEVQKVPTAIKLTYFHNDLVYKAH